MSSPQKPQVTPRKRKETPEEAALRWRTWGRNAILAAGALMVVYTFWSYVWPLISPRVYKLPAMEEMSIEDLVAEFNENGDAAEKKYNNKRVIVSGKLIREPEKKATATSAGFNSGLWCYELGEEHGENALVICEFFDPDGAGSVNEGENVRLSGVVKRIGPKKIRLIGVSAE